MATTFESRLQDYAIVGYLSLIIALNCLNAVGNDVLHEYVEGPEYDREETFDNELLMEGIIDCILSIGLSSLPSYKKESSIFR